jgi:thioredoxin reductase
MRDHDLIVVGAGTAGLTAAMFAGRYGLRVAVVAFAIRPSATARP